VTPQEEKLQSLSGYDMAQLHADLNWQLAKGYLNAVIAVHGARLQGGRYNEAESKYEALSDLVQSFVAEVEERELHL
jgi:hypothetical protein